MTDILEAVSENSQSYTNRIHGISIIEENFVKLEPERVRDKILGFSSSSEDRLQGLLLMKANYERNSDFYIPETPKTICAALEHGASPDIKQTALQIFDRVVKNCSKDSSREVVVANIIPKILPLMFEVENPVLIHTLHSLAQCMDLMPKLLCNHLEEIEQFLFEHLTTFCTEVAEAIGLCFSHLPKCYLMKKKNINSYADAWQIVFVKISNKLGDTMESIKCIEAADDLRLKTPEYLQTFRSFTALSIVMTEVLSLGSKVCVNVPFESLFDCLSQVVNDDVSRKILSSNQNFLFYGFSTLVHGLYSALETLVSVVYVLDCPDQIIQVVCETLNVLTSGGFSLRTTFGVRSSIWKFLHAWLFTTKAQSARPIGKNGFLLNELIKDALFVNEHNKAEFQEENYDEQKRSCCIAAFDALICMTAYGTHFLSKECSASLSKQVLDLNQKVETYIGTPLCPFPFSDDQCRERLYKLMVSCALFSNDMEAKHLTQTLLHLNISLKDKNPEVDFIRRLVIRVLYLATNQKAAIVPDSDAMYNAAEPMQEPAVVNVRARWNIPELDVNEQERFARNIPELDVSEQERLARNRVVSNQVENAPHQQHMFENGVVDEEGMDPTSSPDYQEDFPDYYKPSSSHHQNEERMESDEDDCVEEPAYTPQSSIPHHKMAANSMNFQQHHSPIMEFLHDSSMEEGHDVITNAVTKSLRDPDNYSMVVEDEEVESETSHKEMPENGMDESEEDESDGEEEEEDEDDDAEEDDPDVMEEKSGKYLTEDSEDKTRCEPQNDTNEDDHFKRTNSEEPEMNVLEDVNLRRLNVEESGKSFEIVKLKRVRLEEEEEEEEEGSDTEMAVKKQRIEKLKKEEDSVTKNGKVPGKIDGKDVEKMNEDILENSNEKVVETSNEEIIKSMNEEVIKNVTEEVIIKAANGEVITAADEEVIKPVNEEMINAVSEGVKAMKEESFATDTVVLPTNEEVAETPEETEPSSPSVEDCCKEFVFDPVDEFR